MAFYILFPGHKTLSPKSGDLVCPESKLAKLQLLMAIARKDVGNQRMNSSLERGLTIRG